MNNGIKKGDVLAFKTDTVWGLGCHPLDLAAVKKIYEIKKRDEKKPLILMSNSFEHLEKYIEFIPDYAYDLIEKHLPGGLTLIFEKSSYCPDFITSNSNTIGIRIPDSEDFFNIASKIEGYVLATTSCNVTGEVPVKNYLEAKEKFNDTVKIIEPIEDTINENVPSTVILCKKEEYTVLRQGKIKL